MKILLRWKKKTELRVTSQYCNTNSQRKIIICKMRKENFPLCVENVTTLYEEKRKTRCDRRRTFRDMKLFGFPIIFILFFYYFIDVKSLSDEKSNLRLSKMFSPISFSIAFFKRCLATHFPDSRDNKIQMSAVFLHFIALWRAKS